MQYVPSLCYVENNLTASMIYLKVLQTETSSINIQLYLYTKQISNEM